MCCFRHRSVAGHTVYLKLLGCTWHEFHTREIAENRRRLEELIQENKRTKGESEKKISWAGSSFKTKFWITKSLVCHSTVV